MTARQDVVASMPAHGPHAVGRIGEVWHAVDGVRVEVRFAADTAPKLPVGRAGELQFWRDQVEGPITALGKVAFRGDHGAVRVYHFLFGERTRQTLARLLEPRRTHRVYPDGDEPVEVTLVPPGDEGKAIILTARDVSLTGMGVDVPWEHETRLCQVDALPVRLRLPGHEEELVFEGAVRNRYLGQGAICYGFELVREDATLPDPRFDALQDYVSRLGDGDGTPMRRSA